MSRAVGWCLQGSSGDLLIAVYVLRKNEENVVTLTVNQHTSALQVRVTSHVAVSNCDVIVW